MKGKHAPRHGTQLQAQGRGGLGCREAVRGHPRQVVVLPVVVFLEEAVDVAGGVAAVVGDEEVDEVGRDVVVLGVHHLHRGPAHAPAQREGAELTCQARPRSMLHPPYAPPRPCAASPQGQGQGVNAADGGGAGELVEGDLGLVGEEGRELVEAPEADEGDGVVPGGQGHGVHADAADDAPVGQDGVGRDEDLVHASHHGEDGRIWGARRARVWGSGAGGARGDAVGTTRLTGDNGGGDACLCQPPREEDALALGRPLGHDHRKGAALLGAHFQQKSRDGLTGGEGGGTGALQRMRRTSHPGPCPLLPRARLT